MDALGTVELDAKSVIAEVFRPKDEIREKLMKLQIKEEALQSTILGLKQINKMDNLEAWLQQVRQVSNS